MALKTVDIDLEDFDLNDIVDEVIGNIDEIEDEKIAELKEALKIVKPKRHHSISQEDVSKAGFLEKVANKYTLSYLEDTFPDCV